MTPIEQIVREMLTIYGVKFTDTNSRDVAVDAWSRQLKAAISNGPSERDAVLEEAAKVCIERSHSYHTYDATDEYIATALEGAAIAIRALKGNDAPQAAEATAFKPPSSASRSDVEAMDRARRLWHLQCGLDGSRCPTTEECEAFNLGFKAARLDAVVSEQQQIPNGWKLVPLVPTKEMEKAAAHEDSAYSNNRFTFPAESRFFNVYAAMLRSAPSSERLEGTKEKP